LKGSDTEEEREEPPQPSEKDLKLVIPGAPLSPLSEDLSSTARKRLNIRNTPVEGSKYAEVWRRALNKIKTKLMMKHLLKDLKVYGVDSVHITNFELPEEFKGPTSSEKFYLKPKTYNSGVVKSSTPRFVIMPNSKFKILWNVVVGVLLMYTAIVMPFSIAFVESEGYDKWFWIDVVIDSLFFTDVIINCLSAYYNSEGEIETNQKTIFLSYLKTWMLFDILACIPFGLIEDSSGTQNNRGDYKSLIRLLRIPRLYRMFRITRFLKIFKHYQKAEIIEKLQDFFSLKQTIVRFFTTMITMLLCVHIAACFWCFSSKIEGLHPDTWVVRGNYQDEATGNLYITSVYWAITTLSTVGYGDISAFTPFEKLLSITWMLFGLYFFSFVVGSLSSTLSNIETKENIFNKKMAILDEFSRDASLNKELKRKLRYALRYSSEQTGFSFNDKHQIFDELPKNLRHEVAMAMHKGAVKELTFFENRDSTFISEIVPFLNHEYAEKDHLIYQQNEHAGEIYFLLQGRVHFSRKAQVFKSVMEGSYFGDIEAIKRTPRKFNAVAAKDCALLVMKKDLIQLISEEFPLVYEEMESVAQKKEILNEKAFIEVNEVSKMQNEPQDMHKLKTRIKNKLKKFMADLENQRSTATERNTQKLSHLEGQIEELNNLVSKLDQKLSKVAEKLNVKTQETKKQTHLPKLPRRSVAPYYDTTLSYLCKD